MLDSLCLSPFKFGDTGKKKGSPFAFHMLSNGSNLFDGVTGTQAVCSISGIRWVKRNGVIVSVGPNEVPVEDAGLRGCPAFTQQAKYTEDVTNAVWSKVGSTVLAAGTQFQGQNVFIVTELAQAGVHAVSHPGAFTGVADNSMIGLRLLVKPNGRTKIEFGLYYKDGTYPILVDFDLVTKSYVIKKAGGVASIKELTDGWFELFGAIPCGAGATTPQIYYQFLIATNTYSYVGDGVSGAYVCQPTYINFGVNGIPFIPPYVPNNTTNSVSVVSEAATATTGTSFDLDDVRLSRLKSIMRGPNAQGHLELTFKSNIYDTWMPSGSVSSVNIFTCSDSQSVGALKGRKDATGFFDFRLEASPGGGSVCISQQMTISPGQIIKMSLDWGTHSTGQKMRLTVNGVKSALASFSGSFGAQDLRLLFGNTFHAGWIVKDSLRFIERPLW